ncbi:MAG: site-2 protease family protein [Cyanobacteria bacterium P01_H01_bin.15]
MPWFLVVLLISTSVYLFLRVSLSAAARRQEDKLVKTESEQKPAPAEAVPVPAQAQARPITPGEESTLRNCFPFGIYFLQQIDYRPQAIICMGKLRAVPQKAYETVRRNVEREFGDRFVVMFQESFRGQPFFALVPNVFKEREEETVTKPFLAIALLLLTLVTTTLIGTELSGYDVEAIGENPQILLSGLPYSLALIAVLGVREVSHYLVAVRYHIRATLPYFIPVPFFLGTLGAFIQMRSPIPNRKVLFDVAWAGPVGGFILTLPLLLFGLSQSTVVSLTDESSLVNVKALDPRFSLLLALMSKAVLGNQLGPDMAINLHPLAIAGYIGLVVTAISLMPVGTSDGAHIVHAVWGQKTAALIAQIARVLVFILALTRPEFWLWTIFLFLMPNANQPALNNVTELNNWRDFLGLLALALLILILVPLPHSLSQLLNF